MDWDTFALGTDTSGTSGPRRYGEAQASSTTGPGARRKANSRVAAAQGTRRAAAVAGAAAAVATAGAAAVGADGGPAGRRAWRPPASVAVAARGTRAGPAVVRAADRSIRGDSTSAARRRGRKAARPAAVCGETVCGGTASCGCDGNSRAGGVARRGRRTGCPAPADSGAPAPGPRAAVVAAAVGTGGWRRPAATGSTMEAVAGGTGPAARTGTRAAWAPTSI